VAGATGGALRVEALGSHHDRSGFESGVESLDRYFRTQAGQDARKNMAAPFVLLLPDRTIAGYYTAGKRLRPISPGRWRISNGCSTELA
jgi:hypothetical protein